MYHTTGFTRDEIVGLCARVHAANEAAAESEKISWPPILGLFTSVVVTLTYLRRNRIQAEIGESYGVSQSTVSRAITALTPLLGRALAEHVPVAEDLGPHEHYIVDGTLLPCWSWASHPELYSGKHKTTGLNVQVACTLVGSLAWISDPIDGSRHDTYCLSQSGVLADTPGNWMGDKGYVGNEMLTPIKKPAHRNLLDWEKEFNKQINKIRYVIEQVIANFKTWRIMHTDYRRPLGTFTQTISTVIALHFYKLAAE
jgi:DDE superfamily endonuclease/Helix-turn-helix of DDE superfamily endonuclease